MYEVHPTLHVKMHIMHCCSGISSQSTNVHEFWWLGTYEQKQGGEGVLLPYSAKFLRHIIFVVLVDRSEPRKLNAVNFPLEGVAITRLPNP